jgi:hypothetical protein
MAWVLIYILVITPFQCLADENKIPDEITEAIYSHVDNSYMTESNFKCGNYDVHVTTSCRKIDEDIGRAICYTQHFEFILGNKTKDFFLFNRDFRTEMMVAASATCISAGTHYLLRVNSTNWCNVAGCERADFFDENANYIGSDFSDVGKNIVSGYKKLPKSVDKKLDKLFPTNKTTKQEFNIRLYPIKLIGEYLK